MPDEFAYMVVCIASVLGTISIIISLVIIGVLIHAKEGAQPCGIPIWDWLMLYFAISPIFVLLILPTLCCLRCSSIMCVVSAVLWEVWLVLIFVAFVIIYGYVIYFKEDNTCQDNYDTSVAMVFMCIFLIFGLSQLLLAVTGLFALPILFCMYKSEASEFFEKSVEGLARRPALNPPPEGGYAN